MTNERIEKALASVVELFQAGDVPDAIARATFGVQGKPCARWSLGNRLLMLIAGTTDARGYRQWQEVGRHVTKGSKALYILGPSLKTVREENDNGEIEEHKVLVGFHAIPVFRYEDTQGEPLDGLPADLPDLPLAEVAEAFGVGVRPVDFDGAHLGSYGSARKEIRLASPDEDVFFHELAHAAHERVRGEPLAPGQDPEQEIIAELAAATLARAVGIDTDHEGNAYRSIAHYARQRGWDVPKAILAVLKQVEAVLAEIVGAANAEQTPARQSAAS